MILSGASDRPGRFCLIPRWLTPPITSNKSQFLFWKGKMKVTTVCVKAVGSLWTYIFCQAAKAFRAIQCFYLRALTNPRVGIGPWKDPVSCPLLLFCACAYLVPVPSVWRDTAKFLQARTETLSTRNFTSSKYLNCCVFLWDHLWKVTKIYTLIHFLISWLIEDRVSLCSIDWSGTW